jgi:hypothetical protein
VSVLPISDELVEGAPGCTDDLSWATKVRMAAGHAQRSKKFSIAVDNMDASAAEGRVSAASRLMRGRISAGSRKSGGGTPSATGQGKGGADGAGHGLAEISLRGFLLFFLFFLERTGPSK